MFFRSTTLLRAWREALRLNGVGCSGEKFDKFEKSHALRLVLLKSKIHSENMRTASYLEKTQLSPATPRWGNK